MRMGLQKNFYQMNLEEEMLQDQLRRKVCDCKASKPYRISICPRVTNEPGEAQKDLGIEKEASYIISVIKS